MTRSSSSYSRCPSGTTSFPSSHSAGTEQEDRHVEGRRVSGDNGPPLVGPLSHRRLVDDTRSVTRFTIPLTYLSRLVERRDTRVSGPPSLSFLVEVVSPKLPTDSPTSSPFRRTSSVSGSSSYVHPQPTRLPRPFTLLLSMVSVSLPPPRRVSVLFRATHTPGAPPSHIDLVSTL